VSSAAATRSSRNLSFSSLFGGTTTPRNTKEKGKPLAKKKIYGHGRMGLGEDT